MEENKENQINQNRPFQKKIYYQRKEENPERISKWTALFLIITAFFVDLVELFITYIGVVVIGGILSIIVSFGATALFGIWFAILGVNQSGNTKNTSMLSKKMLTQIGTVMAENIPFLDAIPLAFFWTIGMILTIWMVRSEDKNGIINKATKIVPSMTNKMTENRIKKL